MKFVIALAILFTSSIAFAESHYVDKFKQLAARAGYERASSEQEKVDIVASVLRRIESNDTKQCTLHGPGVMKTSGKIVHTIGVYQIPADKIADMLVEFPNPHQYTLYDFYTSCVAQNDVVKWRIKKRLKEYKFDLDRFIQNW